MLHKLKRIYGDSVGTETYHKLLSLIGETPAKHAPLAIDETDVILITYGDQVHTEGEAPLKTLHTFLNKTIQGVIKGVHILPFYPYSSDDGFSVIDYYAVNPDFGTWDDVNALHDDFRLMFDAVFNHISAQSAWFQGFIKGEEPYKDYFTVVPEDTDLSAVVRPRTLPLLTPVETPDGIKHVWTTFSADQVDVNAANPDVLLELIQVLLFYVMHGASFIRLDAIAFLWKEIGTNCIHLEKTHLIIQLMRDVLDRVAPHVILITETNVPHEENISYFGNGKNEAQMVYQFPLPPLTLHTLRTGDATKLSNWADSLGNPGKRTTYFNFTASHDGIGMRPTTNILTQDEIDALVQLAKDHGGLVSYRHVPGQPPSPYELNISYFDAITDPKVTAENPDVAVDRFIVSQAIQLSLAGVPGIYFHSLFGSRNDHAGYEKTQQNRTINRQKFDVELLEDELKHGIRQQVYSRYQELLRVRTSHKAFHPLGEQKILQLHPGVFAVQRTHDGSTVLALHNVTPQAIDLPNITGRDLFPHSGDHTLIPYEVRWLIQD